MLLFKDQQFRRKEILLDKQLWKWLTPAIILGLLAGSLLYGLAQPVNAQAGDKVMFTVVPGITTKEIGEQLYAQGLIKNVLLFRVLARIQGLENSLQAGEYAVSKSMGTGQIIGMLARGETAYRQFTVPEGFTIDQIASLLESQKLASSSRFKTCAASYAPYGYIEPRGDAKFKAEGFLFPDTYRVMDGATEEDIVKKMVEQFNQKFTPEMRQRADELGLSLEKVVTLASLVEKEAKVDKERPIVAAVFLNRLKMDMPLQSCATIQYILGYPKPELSVEDTERPSPYNTYQNMGLPPGPIASPGLASINAVLFPAETDYLYFVAYKNGEHLFSKTYEEHLAAIARASQ